MKVKVKSLSRVWLLATPWTAAHQASLSITNSRSLLKLMSIESVMPSNHLCCPLLLPSVFPNIRIFPNKSVLRIRWPKYWSFSFSIIPSNEYSGLISFRIKIDEKHQAKVLRNFPYFKLGVRDKQQQKKKGRKEGGKKRENHIWSLAPRDSGCLGRSRTEDSGCGYSSAPWPRRWPQGFSLWKVIELQVHAYYCLHIRLWFENLKINLHVSCLAINSLLSPTPVHWIS